MLPLLFEIMMLVTSCCGVLLGGWLLWQGQRQPAMPALAGFAVMMAFWCAGHVFVLHQWPHIGSMLLLANPVMPMCFLHFAVKFVGQEPVAASWLKSLDKILPWLYLLTMAVVFFSWFVRGADIVASGVFSHYFVFQGWGWLNLIYTVALGMLAHAVLVYGWFKHSGNKRRSIVAVFIAGAWGLLLATSFVFPSLGLNWYPYPMLLLPSYVLLLVYGVVRYQVLAINAFANKALLWLVMMLVVLIGMALVSAFLGQLGLKPLAEVPAWQLWLYSTLLLVLAAACYQPVTTVARRLIYPGLQLTERSLDDWRNQLRKADSWQQLAVTASELISRQMGQQVAIELADTMAPVASSVLKIRCYADWRSGWRFELSGWDDVTPAYRLTGDIFGSLLVSSCSILENSLQLAEAERRRLDQQHLVELGALSASMAHELRNPLNIIAMAAVTTPTDTRQHIQQQLQRADRLIADLLSYSGQLQLQFSHFSLLALVETVVSQQDWHGVQCDIALVPELTLYADQHRVQQVLVNLLDNALSFCRNKTDAIIRIEAIQKTDSILLFIHNNGPAIPLHQHSQLFQPFVSKRRGGSGLGLAIVKRIMSAHHGNARHRTDLGWPVSFELHFPILQESSNHD